MAEILLNNLVLRINNKLFRLCEIEYYLKKNKSHNDIFTHCDKDQATPYRWYFHRQNGQQYKGGTYKGLDLTFGYEHLDEVVYGGILIRSICDLENNEVIEGPCKVVNKILEVNNKKSIQDFINDQKALGGYDKLSDTLSALECNGLRIELTDNETNNLIKLDIYSGPRVGLTLKKLNKLREKYIMKNYRFLVHPDKIKKCRSGIVIKLLNDGLSELEISNHTNIKISYIFKYKVLAEEGTKKTFKDFHKKNLSTNDLCQLQGLWQAMYN